MLNYEFSVDEDFDIRVIQANQSLSKDGFKLVINHNQLCRITPKWHDNKVVRHMIDLEIQTGYHVTQYDIQDRITFYINDSVRINQWGFVLPVKKLELILDAEKKETDQYDSVYIFKIILNIPQKRLQCAKLLIDTSPIQNKKYTNTT